uniref:GOLD domain-containing protein n=1 Tax=Trypanosoma congolense (strain IL3000) TaxID=1068625 RepID=G0UXB1_TRYCI|nr:conserved hypothetical protein [Trypanosoma congolense IL3000]
MTRAIVGVGALRQLALFLKLITVFGWTATSATGDPNVGVYVKLFPGRELCVSYEGYRAPGEEAPTVDLQHRAFSPRNVNVRTLLYGPDGRRIGLDSRIDPLGQPSSLFFKITVTGTYRVCMRIPLNHPPLKFDMRFVGERDVVQSPETVEGVGVVDKPIEASDYKSALNMLDICVQVALDEIRMSESRLHLLDDLTNSTYNYVMGMLIINVFLVISMGIATEKYLEWFFVKKKVA